VNTIRRKLADLLFEMSRKAMDELDGESPCTKAMKKKSADTSALLRSDIERLCAEIRVMEAGRVLAIYAKLKASNTEATEKQRKKLVDIASKVIARVEKNGGPLNLPSQCREFLINVSGNP